jgi:hypothetical protein
MFLLFPSPSRLPALFVVPGPWIFAWLAGREPLPLTPLNATLLLMFWMVLVRLWATYDIAVSPPKISGMVLGMGFLFAVAREAECPQGTDLIRFREGLKSHTVQTSIHYSFVHRFFHLRDRMPNALLLHPSPIRLPFAK